MSSAVPQLILAQGALLNGSWWVARSLRASDGRSWTWLIWACLGLAVVGVGFDLVVVNPSGPAGGAVTTALIFILDAACLAVVAARATRALPAQGELKLARKADESGNPGAAAEAYHKVARHLGSSWKRVQELEALAGEGRMRLDAGQARAAADIFKTMAAKARTVHDARAEARALRWIGDAAFEYGDRQAARRGYWDAINAGQAMGNYVVVARGLTRLAWMEHVAGDLDLAREYFAWAARLDVGEADIRLTASLMLLAACFRMAEGRLETARPASEDSIRLSNQVRDTAQEASGRMVLGCVQYLEGLYESGAQIFEEHSRARLPIQARRVAGLLAAGMSFVARRLNRTADAAGFGALASGLLAGHPILAAVGALAASPGSTPSGEALRVEGLVHPVPAASPVLAGAR